MEFNATEKKNCYVWKTGHLKRHCQKKWQINGLKLKTPKQSEKSTTGIYFGQHATTTIVGYTDYFKKKG